MAPFRSRHLAGLSPSTYPPPLGERNRQSMQTTSHIDSHTMGDHENPTPTYEPSPDIPTHSGYDPSFTGHQYWFLGDETHHKPVSTSYGMSGIPTHDPTQHAESEFEPNTTLGGTPIPFHVERFGNTSHIAPSILAVEPTSHVHPRPGVSIPIRIPEPI